MSNTAMDFGITLPVDFLSGPSYAGSLNDSGFEYDEYESEPLKEMSLWQSVIVQAVLDATCAPVNSKARREKTKGIIWLSMQNKDFLFVCELAGLNPIYVIKGAKKAIKQSTANHRRKIHMKRLRNSKNYHEEPIKKETSQTTLCYKKA